MFDSKTGVVYFVLKRQNTLQEIKQIGQYQEYVDSDYPTPYEYINRMSGTGVQDALCDESDV